MYNEVNVIENIPTKIFVFFHPRMVDGNYRFLSKICPKVRRKLPSKFVEKDKIWKVLSFINRLITDSPSEGANYLNVPITEQRIIDVITSSTSPSDGEGDIKEVSDP